MKTNEPNEPGSREHARQRLELIERCLAAVGQTWAADYIHQMSAAGRRIEGGWPGRLAEARALALRDLTRQLAARAMPPPSADELNRAPAIVNDHARQHWGNACRVKRLSAKGPPTSAK